MRRDLLTTTSVVVLCVMVIGWCGGTAAVAQQPPPAVQMVPVPPTISVNGQGEVSARPDRAAVSLGATVQSDNAAAAQAEVNKIMQGVLDAVKKTGIAEERIQTSGLTLQPVYTHHQPPRPMGEAPQEPKIVGYRASNTVRVEIDDLTKIGAVIDAGIGSGANQLEYLTFELKEDAAQRAAALTQAAADARAKADAIAAAMGVKITEIHEVVEGGVQLFKPEYMGRAMMAMDAAGGTPVQPGQVKVQANLTVRYRIEQ